VGSNFLDLVPEFVNDPETDAVVLFSEPGGIIEEKLAEWYVARDVKLPVIVFIAGKFVDDMPGVRFGHAATIVEGSVGSAKGKIKVLQEAGIFIAEKFSDIIYRLKEVT
jgi:succinyl-CoA synthetase alpha subunit